ncbi:MAG: hypothetical protein NTZ35_03570 [Ignavibacteriales bacterium]|nr:hypothetical protein [Ignavibacteriales bacterium]
MKTRATFLVMTSILLVVSAAMSQQEVVGRMNSSHEISLTGNARLDLLANIGAMNLKDTVLKNVDEGRKSPLLAGVLSLAVPGAGEFYTQSYWRAGGFILAEAGLWVVYAVYSSKGDQQTSMFQDFADGHWSVFQYAKWVQDNAVKLNPDVTSFIPCLIPGTDNLQPWDRVNWDLLNTIENRIAQLPGNGFTHLLPHRPQQQYFELIGKYPQFAAGWDDAGVMTPQRIVNSDVSQRFLDYAAMRGKANDYYNIATRGSVLLVVNHLLSALDAAWSAAQFNNQLKLEAHLQPVVRSADFVEFVPTARLTIRF